jgi:penicillin-binding protein 1A
MAIRSSGSAFKYFVYLVALEQGIGVHDLVSDLPLSIGGWRPKNHKYKSVGEIPLLEAFSRSVNTAAVRIARRVGMDRVIAKAERLGITSEIKDNIASALGASGVTLIDITACFGSTMTNGYKMTPFGVMSIRTPSGKYLYRARQKPPPRVISPEAGEKMKTLLRQVVETGTGRQARLPMTAYGKTGTSNDNRDASFIGFSSNLVAGVWIGNDDNSPMGRKMYGGFLPAMAWREFMLLALGYKQLTDEKKIANNEKSTAADAKAAQVKENSRKKLSVKNPTRKLSDFVKPILYQQSRR